MPDLIITGQAAGPCGCCGTPERCLLTMPTNLIDATTTPYADLSTAEAALADQALGCIVEASESSSSGKVRTAGDASYSAGTLDITSSMGVTAAFGTERFLFGALMSAGTLTVAYVLDGSGDVAYGDVEITLYDSDWSEVDSDLASYDELPPVTDSLSVVVPSSGLYFLLIRCVAGNILEVATSDLSFSISGAGLGLPCLLRAAYDDGGTQYLNCEELP